MGPPDGYERRMFCSPRLSHDGKFCHIYASRMAVSACGVKKDEAVEVIVRPKPGGGHWAWWSARHQKLSLVWRTRLHLSACFTYGMQAAIDVGDGIDVEVEVVPVGEE